MSNMDQTDLKSTREKYLDEQICNLKTVLSYGLSVTPEEIKISFPNIENFYPVNNIYKSSWAIYTQEGTLPKLLFTGNFFIQGGQENKYSKRSKRSPFGAPALSHLTSVANTFSYNASIFKQNWTLDLNLLGNDSNKLNLSVEEYKDFLKLLNLIRIKWLLHVSEEGNFDFVISEVSEPSDSLYFMGIESFDSTASKIKTYFKPISEEAVSTFKSLAETTEFEGKFSNLQPGTWIKDDVLIELEKLYSNKFYNSEIATVVKAKEFNVLEENPFKVEFQTS